MTSGCLCVHCRPNQHGPTLGGASKPPARMEGSLSKKTQVCSFCGASRDTVGVLVSTPQFARLRAYICDACVITCLRIVLKYTNDSLPEGVKREVHIPRKGHTEGRER